jgi:predicted  nucleic acid-binding Zn-ribbon protein
MGNFDREEQGITLNESIKASLYPNPNNGSFIVSYDLQKETNIDILVSDISGKVVYKVALDDLNNLQTINLSDVQNGIYFVQLVNKDSKLFWTNKVIISK